MMRFVSDAEQRISRVKRVCMSVRDKSLKGEHVGRAFILAC
jgi:hypothetical protein